MGEHLLHITEYAENIFCIYRNYFTRGRLWKFWMAFRIIMEIIIIIGYQIVWVKHYTKPASDMMYIFMTSWYSALVLFLAVYHSRTYASFKSHLNFGYRVFVRDDNYRKNLKAKYSGLIFLVAFIVLSKTALFVYNLFFPYYTYDLTMVWHWFIQINGVVCDLRYIFEFLVLYCFLYVMHEQINLITRSLKGDKSLLDMESELVIQIIGDKNQRMMSEVHKWCLGYKHVRQSCKFFNTIFGFQLTFMLTASIAFYILLVYATTSETVLGHLSPVGVVMYTADLFLMLYILLMLSHSAQQMQNSADILRRRLCKVLILSLSERHNYQATKDLLRMMSTCPIRIHAFGTVPVDMTLFPTCISFFTTYTVIALQFNNVL